MPTNRERIASCEGAHGTQTLYMTESMKTIEKSTRANEPAHRLAPGAY
jgi:hypothetical protein